MIYYQKNERYSNKRARGKKTNKQTRDIYTTNALHPRNLASGKELLIYLFSLAHSESGEGSDLEGLGKSGIKSTQITRESLWIS